MLGWSVPIPVLIEMNELEENHRPKSKDPDFWDVWTNKSKRDINWEEIVKEWQAIKEKIIANYRKIHKHL